MRVDYFRNNFHPFLVVGLIVSFFVQCTFIVRYDLPMAPLDSYVINLVMSVLFVGMYFARPDGAGLSKTVAWTKFVGTLCYSVGNSIILMRIPTVQYEVQVRQSGTEQWNAAGMIGSATIRPGLLYFLFIGTAIFDLIYLWLLYRGPSATDRAPARP